MMIADDRQLSPDHRKQCSAKETIMETSYVEIRRSCNTYRRRYVWPGFHVIAETVQTLSTFFSSAIERQIPANGVRSKNHDLLSSTHGRLKHYVGKQTYTIQWTLPESK